MRSFSTFLAKITASPIGIRVVPFVVFILLTALQGTSGQRRFWIYGAKTLVGAWMIWVARPHIPEMRWRLSLEAIVVGIGIFVLWVGLDPFYPKFTSLEKPWNPFAQFGQGSGFAWAFVAVRLVGSAVIVPPLEEVFYRSFLYRYLASPDFEKAPLHKLNWIPFLVCAAIFGFGHYQWLAGIVCGLAYQGLVIRKGRLGDAMTAHAVTNALLGVWVVWRGVWQFW